jgi:hypothetical protein
MSLTPRKALPTVKASTPTNQRASVGLELNEAVLLQRRQQPMHSRGGKGGGAEISVKVAPSPEAAIAFIMARARRSD